MEKEKTLLKLKNVSKYYYNNGMISSGISKVNLTFNTGEFVAITGESGSGKSTLLNVLSGLDSYEEGEMYINGQETSHYSDTDFEEYRKTYIASIFQSFNLVNSYTVYQNIELVMLLNGYHKKEVKNKIIELIKKVDLYKYRNTKVSHLSGGQKQRVAIARALAKDTPIIVADEPTGNLDSKAAQSVVKLLSEIAKNKLVIVVTHNYEQIEKYVTRKIEMFDGKIRDDEILKETKVEDYTIQNYQNITYGSKIRLGIRNTFNIFTKFVLMFIVFLFICLAISFEYSSMLKSNDTSESQGYNNYFIDASTTRIVINKKDHSSITSDDFTKIKNLENVDKIIENDFVIDNSFIIGNSNYSYIGYFNTMDEITSVDLGRLPEKDNEIVLKISSYNYSESLDEALNKTFYVGSSYASNSNFDVTVVGIIFDKSVSLFSENIYTAYYYGNDNLLNDLRSISTDEASSSKITINDVTYEDNNSIYYYSESIVNFKPSKNVTKGNCYIDSSLNSICTYENCLNNNIKIQISNIYYDSEINLKVTNTYNKNNINALLGISDYDANSNNIYISQDDYNYLFNRDTYQASIYANDKANVDTLVSELKDLGYNTIAIKDSLYNLSAELTAITSLFRKIVALVLFVVIFFVSYFVIKLIQKSKNIYYATVRILGGSKNDIKSIIRMELYTIFNLTYLVFITLIILVSNKIINIKLLNSLITYLNVKDYILIYLILFIISYLISKRYSKDLFKGSALSVYRKEV